jgi:hypothetical protein
LAPIGNNRVIDMGRKLIITTLLMVFVLLGSTRFLDDNDYIQDEIILHANLNNRGSIDAAEDVRTKFLVLGTDIRGTSSSSRIRSGGIMQDVIPLDAKNLQPAEYWVRIYVYGENGQRHIRHRPIIVQ